MDNETTATPNRKRRAAAATRSYLSAKEVDRVAKEAAQVGRNGQRDELLIRMMFWHGLRVSEACSLEWSQIDFDESKLHVARLKGSTDTVHPIPKPRRAPLLSWRRAQAKAADTRGEVTPRYVFASEQGTPLDRSVVHRIVARAGQLADFGLHVHPHMLRHACGYELANRSEATDTRVIQDFLGHASITNTVRYTKLNSKRFEGLWKE